MKTTSRTTRLLGSLALVIFAFSAVIVTSSFVDQAQAKSFSAKY